MSGPHDTQPPSAPPTAPMLPVFPETEYLIPAGQARAACLDVLGDLARSLGRTEALMQALARALDAASYE